MFVKSTCITTYGFPSICFKKVFGVSADYLINDINDNCESDMDIPAVKNNELKLRKHFKYVAWKIASIVATLMGKLGMSRFGYYP